MLTCFRSQLIISLYGVTLGHAKILCSSDYATNRSLAEKDSSPSLAKSYAHIRISCSKISYTFFQDLMVSIIHGVVSNRMSVFGLESSVDVSCFFASLHGTIILREMKLSFL
jgi:hypothetical protein